MKDLSTFFSEGSCVTEDWSNDAENSALHQRNTLHFKMYYYKTVLNYDFSHITVYCTFDHIS